MSNASYTIHGGAWNDDEVLARAVYRDFIRPDDCYYNVGFRAVEGHGIYVVRSGAGHRVAALARGVDRLYIHPVHHYPSIGFRIMERTE